MGGVVDIGANLRLLRLAADDPSAKRCADTAIQVRIECSLVEGTERKEGLPTKENLGSNSVCFFVS